jgi:hypothetical protein
VPHFSTSQTFANMHRCAGLVCWTCPGAAESASCTFPSIHTLLQEAHLGQTALMRRDRPQFLLGCQGWQQLGPLLMALLGVPSGAMRMAAQNRVRLQAGRWQASTVNCYGPSTGDDTCDRLIVEYGSFDGSAMMIQLASGRGGVSGNSGGTGCLFIAPLQTRCRRCRRGMMCPPLVAPYCTDTTIPVITDRQSVSYIHCCRCSLLELQVHTGNTATLAEHYRTVRPHNELGTDAVNQ